MNLFLSSDIRIDYNKINSRISIRQRKEWISFSNDSFRLILKILSLNSNIKIRLYEETQKIDVSYMNRNLYIKRKSSRKIRDTISLNHEDILSIKSMEEIILKNLEKKLIPKMVQHNRVIHK